MLFLLLFSMLVVLGRVQIWMGIFLLSVILTLFFGRFYCGWICPINTVMNFVAKIKSQLHLKGLTIPEFVKKPFYRYGMLTAFILAFIFVMASGKKLPVLPGLLVIGAFLTVFYPENLWHRHLCPYGTILHMVGKLSKRHYTVAEDLCIACGICRKACPAEALQLYEGKYVIAKSECLVCGSCDAKCPKKAIRYQ
jgi:ferredoxin-type protein NapH